MKNRLGSWIGFVVLGCVLLAGGCGVDAFREGATGGVRNGLTELVSFFFTGFLTLIPGSG